MTAPGKRAHKSGMGRSGNRNVWGDDGLNVAVPTGSIARAAEVVDALGAAPRGATLAEVAQRTGYSKTTAHRVLGALRDVGWAVQDPAARTWRLGHRLGRLSHRAGLVDLAEIARPFLSRVAAETGDTVFLSMREGPAALCLAREVGAHPIRTLTLDEGARRPLGVGAGAMALYAALPDPARAAAARANAAWLAEYGEDAASLERLAARTRAAGHALNDGRVVAAMSAVAVTVPGTDLAIALGAIDGRMSPERIEAVILPALRREAAALSARLGSAE